MPKSATVAQTKIATKTANSKPKGGGEKTKREPSAWNLFVGQHLKQWRLDHPDEPPTAGMKAVAAMWADSPENPKRGQPVVKKAPKAPKEPKAAKADKPKSKAKSSKAKAKPAKEEAEEEDEGDDEEDKENELQTSSDA